MLVIPSAEEDQLRLAAIGRFVLQFAGVEHLLFHSLIMLSGVENRMGQALFSGVRADGAIKQINRILEVRTVSKIKRDRYTASFEHLQWINHTRNLILHYGLEFHYTELVATDRIRALREVNKVPVSTEILDQMTADLQKIAVLLAINLVDNENEIQGDIAGVESTLQRAWLYIPPSRQQNHQKRTRRENSQDP